MLNALRRLLSRAPKAGDPAVLVQWAERHGHRCVPDRHHTGCVIEGQLGTQAWRIEWGPPQRSYIGGQELRFLADTPVPRELTALVLNQSLAETMEKLVYEQFVDDVQTRIETETPPEMRWLVMYPKANAAELGALRDRYTAVGSSRPWLQHWLASPLGAALTAAQRVTAADEPVALTLHRGRLALRIGMPEADTVRLTTWFAVFEQALREALQAGADWTGGPSNNLLATRSGDSTLSPDQD